MPSQSRRSERSWARWSLVPIRSPISRLVRFRPRCFISRCSWAWSAATRASALPLKSPNERLRKVKKILIPVYCVMAMAAVHEACAQDMSRVRFAGIRKYAQVVTGDYTVPVGASTSGSVMVIRGNLDVYGSIDGAATAVLGDVIVHDGGRVRGGAVALGGRVINAGGSVLGVIKEVGATHNRATVSFGGRPRTTIGSLISAVLWLLVLLLVGTVVALY